MITMKVTHRIGKRITENDLTTWPCYPTTVDLGPFRPCIIFGSHRFVSDKQFDDEQDAIEDATGWLDGIINSILDNLKEYGFIES